MIDNGNVIVGEQMSARKKNPVVPPAWTGPYVVLYLELFEYLTVDSRRHRIERSMFLTAVNVYTCPTPFLEIFFSVRHAIESS